MHSNTADHLPLTSPSNLAVWASVALLAGMGVAIYGWVAVHAYTAITFSDSLDYVMMADFYNAVLSGGDREEAAAHYRVTRFPPLFSMVIGFMGGGTANQHIASIVSLSFSVLASLAVWLWIRREEYSLGTANVIAAALLLYPAYFMISLNPVSEPFAIFLSALALALMAKGNPNSSTWLAASMVIGLSLLGRTALLPLAIAMLIVSLQRGCSWKRLLLLAATSLAPLASWTLYRRAIGATNYGTSLSTEKLLGELGGWPDALWLQPTRLIKAIASNWGFEPTIVVWLLSAALIVLASFGLIERIRRKKVDAWFVLGYLAMILVWPYPFELGRFMVLVYPMCLLAAIDGWTSLFAQRQTAAARLPHWLPVALVVVLASAPAYSQYIRRAMLAVDPMLLDEKREQYFFALEGDDSAVETAEIFLRTRMLAMEIQNHVPEGECVYSTLPQVVSLYGKRQGASIPFDLQGETDAKRRLIHCQYFLLAGIDIATYDVPAFYPSEMLRPWTKPVLVSSVDDNHAAAVLLKVVAGNSDSGQDGGDTKP